MATVCIFFIGSGHFSGEDQNVLVVLNRMCGLGNLGIEGNHQAGKISRFSKRADDATDDNFVAADGQKNGGWHWINEGQDGAGSGLNQQAIANVNRIKKIKKNHLVDKVVLVGHSRGAVCAMMVAHKLYKDLGADSPSCHLFLFDPVKRSAVGMANTIIENNVKSLRVLVAEDNADKMIKTSGKDMFTPTLPRTNGGSNPNYLRIPGTHGTMTQVNGMPIGKLGCLLAVEWLASVNIPMEHGMDLRPSNFCLVYSDIIRLNPIFASANGKQMRTITDMGKVKTGQAVEVKHVPVGGGIVTRSEEEYTWQGTKNVGLTRSGYLESSSIRNKWQGNTFFVNEDHRARFSAAYPWCSRLVEGAGLGGRGASMHVQSELKMMPQAMRWQFEASFAQILRG